MRLTLKTCTVILIAIAFLMKADTARASHAAGAELLYEWKNDSVYTIYLKFYRDCSGVDASGDIKVEYCNTCDASRGIITLQRMATLPNGKPNGSPVTVGCSSYPTSCDDASSGLPGYREWWYSDTVKLPKACNHWTFSTSISARNKNVNLSSNITTPLYIEATLDNLNAPRNSSPFFSVRPVPYVCQGQNYSYNNGASDADNDSLAFEMISPMESASVGFCGSGMDIPFMTPASPPFNLTNNPFQTNNTFNLDPVTGQMSFIPALIGAQAITIRVNEYRNHKQIGSVIRDIQISSLQCSSSQPQIDIDTTTLQKDSVVSKTIQACADVPMQFCFDIKSPEKDAVLVVTDNHDAVIPASNISYSANKTDSIRACFSWTPTRADVGLKIFTVTVKDSTCRPPGISIAQTFTYPINVRSAQSSVYDTAICKYDTITLKPFVGTKFEWSVQPGGSLGTLSCVFCPNPRVWPGTNTNYLLKTDMNAFCGKNIDTVKVSVKQEVPDLPSATSNTPVCVGETIKLYGSDITDGGYQWHGPNGFTDTTRNPVIPNVTFANQGQYYIQTYSYTSQCPSKSGHTYVEILPIPRAFFQYPENICIDQVATIRPDLDYNSVYFWNFANATKVDTSKLNIHYLAWNDTGAKNVILRLRGVNGCYSYYDTGTVYVHPLPEAKITEISRNDICTGDTIDVEALDIDGYHYEWTPAPYFYDGRSAATKAVVTQKGMLLVNVTDQWGCVAKDSIYIAANPCCNVYLPDAFTPNGDGKNDIFRVITEGHHLISKFLITNRWGQRVFETADERQGWDGTYHGLKQDIGTYFYYLRYKCSDDRYVDKKGEITLIR